MKKNVIYYDFKDVRERDMDFMMMEEFCASQEFADLFLAKVGKAGAEVVRVYHSKYEKHMGESDMIVVCMWQGVRHALLIEDKIDAEAMPYQSSRYFDRAEEDVLKGEYASYDIFITAPGNYLSYNHEARLYPNSVSYEEIETYMQTKTDVRYQFKLQMINKALGRQQRGYEAVEHVKVASFWDGYMLELKNGYQHLVCTNADKTHCGNSHWPRFKSPCPGSEIIHKGDKGYVDLQFRGMGDNLGALKLALENITCNTNGAYPAKATKSGSIRINCPKLDFKGRYEDQTRNIRICLKVIDRIYNIAKEIKL